MLCSISNSRLPREPGLLFYLFGAAGAVFAASAGIWLVTTVAIGIDKTGAGEYLLPPFFGSLAGAFFGIILGPVVMFFIHHSTLELYGNIIGIAAVVGSLGGVLSVLHDQKLLSKVASLFRSGYRSARRGARPRSPASAKTNTPTDASRWQVDRFGGVPFHVLAKRGTISIELPIYRGSLARGSVDQEIYFGDQSFGRHERALKKPEFVAAVESSGSWRFVKLRAKGQSYKTANTLIVDVVGEVTAPPGDHLVRQ